MWDDEGVLRGQEWGEAGELPVMVETLGALPAWRIAALHTDNPQIEGEDGEWHHARSAIDRMLWVERQRERAAQNDLHRWWGWSLPLLRLTAINTRMTDKQPKRNNGAGVKRAAIERKDAASSLAAISEQKDRALAIRGKDKPITDEMREEALIMLANGHPMDRVCEFFGVDRCSLIINGNKNPDFGTRLREAMAIGTISIINDITRTVNGEPGYSTGSIERDKLKTDHAWRYAKTIGNRWFGERLQVDQRTISISLRNDSTDW